MTEEAVTGSLESLSRSESPAIIPPTDPESLSVAVRTQVEYYFSKENLRTDSFLQSKMDSQNAAPLATVMGFPKIMALTRDPQVVIKSLESSHIVALVDGKIKPKGSGRSTIILREIPSNSSEESIREIFNYSGAKPICSIRSEIGDTWFVTMESEEDAKDTIMDLKLKKRCFDNVPVKARLKTDAGLRSYYPTATVLPLAYPGMTFQPYGMPLESQVGYNYGESAPPSTSPTSQDREKTSGYNRKENSEAGWTENGGEGGYNNSRRDGKESRDRNSRNLKGHSNGPNRKSPNKTSGRDRKEGSASAPPPPPIEINSAADFPPLHPQFQNNPTVEGDPTTPSSIPLASTVINSTTQQPAQTNIPSRGYSTPYARYSIDDILQLVSGIKEAVLPGSINPSQHPLALVTSPNTDLLLRQRTFSIDETKEQMQLGRPVQREAVITGEVDYGSLIYGEEDHASAQASELSDKKAAAPPPAAKNTGGSWAGVLMKGGAPVPQVESKPVSTPVKQAPQAVTEKTPVVASSPSTASKGEKKVTEKKKSSKPQQEGSKKDGNTTTTDGKKEGNATTTEVKKEGNATTAEVKKGRNRRRAGSQGDSNAKSTEEGTEKSDASAPVPSSWGGRPTFANVLKQQEAEAAAASITTSPAPVVSSTPVKPASVQVNSNQQNRQGGKQQSNDKEKGHKSQNENSKKLMTNPDGTWVRDKLPPR